MECEASQARGWSFSGHEAFRFRYSIMSAALLSGDERAMVLMTLKPLLEVTHKDCEPLHAASYD